MKKRQRMSIRNRHRCNGGGRGKGHLATLPITVAGARARGVDRGETGAATSPPCVIQGGGGF